MTANINKFINKFIISKSMIKRGQKKGQITIFVIVAVVIIAAVILFFAFTDYGKNLVRNFSGGEMDFNSQVSNCIQNSKVIKNNIKLIMSQGGSLDPKTYFLYNDTKLTYLCYINEYYKPCIMQNPNLIYNTNQEIKNSIQTSVRDCFDAAEADLKSRGYQVNKGSLNLSVEIVPKKILIHVDYPFTVTKADSSQRYSNFDFIINGNYYQLITISTSILNYEARYGESEILSYMALYPQIRLLKLKQGDSSTLYLLSDRYTGDNFNFAVRSYAWPAGYKL